jgi:hypothetical protein
MKKVILFTVLVFLVGCSDNGLYSKIGQTKSTIQKSYKVDKVTGLYKK